ncbi:protein of unknown function DUF45 [Prosthecochloris aestuarii DSM 271]|uniref:YgjP-like metallopeptidase domain-containing protein n=1 Tax=Prosthecochloris aestuarii (strain DSM 271 / SK 413) TaxID=290512 RepID=B4S6Z7_PROA2|nr:SprT family zinc-dependent metalloprotease [Prosthecochloris aestuarii]ACF45834.1 protein of unknown function DUF45 [Prosthecochloris aestuarii DSM 271]
MSYDIAYSVKVNHRLKYARLSIGARGELVVLVPSSFDQTLIPDLVRQKKEWIAQTRKKVMADQQQSRGPSDVACELPSRLVLHSINEVWQVSYRAGRGSVVEAQVIDTNRLMISGDASKSDLVYRLLRMWLKQKASLELVPWLERLSVANGLNYSRAVIRHQKTRWGSYSGRGTVSLNMKLLFLPEHLVHHVLIHELCHTVHLNHSSSFWKLVARYDPAYMEHRVEMKRAGSYIPHFVDAG